MLYQGDETSLEWQGATERRSEGAVLWAENEQGRAFIALGTGGLVPENWIGRRVRVTIELLDAPE